MFQNVAYRPTVYRTGALVLLCIYMIQAVFIDFQAMQPGAIGRDIWNYLYTATDSGPLHLFKFLAVG